MGQCSVSQTVHTTNQQPHWDFDLVPLESPEPPQGSSKHPLEAAPHRTSLVGVRMVRLRPRPPAERTTHCRTLVTRWKKDRGWWG